MKTKTNKKDKSESKVKKEKKVDKKSVEKDAKKTDRKDCLLYTSPSPRDISGSRMPSSA